MDSRSLVLSVAAFMFPCWDSARAEKLPPDDAYIQVQDGQLVLNGERKRFWAAIGKLLITAKVKPGDSPEARAEKIALSRKGTDVLLTRFEQLGFNAFRFWDSVPNTEDYVVGDGSEADCVDYFLKEAAKRGFRIWAASLNRTGHATAADVDILADPATAEEWKAAVRASKNEQINLRENIARVWDPRLEKLCLVRMSEIAGHRNKHNGLRWADDPIFSVWELSNEEWWMRKMVGGQWQKLPPLFQRQLIEKWNAWLKKKYGTSEALKTAWTSLLDGEQVETGTVALLPMAGAAPATVIINDANALARESLETLPQEFSRGDFAIERGEDVIAFFLDLQLSHKNRMAGAVKAFGKSTSLSPLLFDTGIGYEIHSQFMHQNAEAISHNAYVNGWGPTYQAPSLADAPNPQQAMLRELEAERLAANSGRWVNWLLKPPGISQGVPWLEHNRVSGKPFVVYETQIQQPAKYRADFPLRLLTLGSIQDWDWVSWHYFASTDDVGALEKPFEKALDVTAGRHPQGYHYTFDEVQLAMMRAAGYMFRGFAFKPAPNPTVFRYGRKSLLSPDAMDYAGSYGVSGMDMFTTTYQHGVRIEINPTKENDEVSGPVVTFADRNVHNPYQPTEQIEINWKKGFYRLDAPSALAWTGLMAKYGDRLKFSNGVEVSDVSINNPVGIFDPVREDEKYLAFALYSEDGKPLETAKKVAISAVSTSFNTGFSMADDFIEGYGIRTGSVGVGSLPVLVARVGATVSAKALDGMNYVYRDWNYANIGEGRVVDGKITIPSDRPVFLVELTR